MLSLPFRNTALRILVLLWASLCLTTMLGAGCSSNANEAIPEANSEGAEGTIMKLEQVVLDQTVIYALGPPAATSSDLDPTRPTLLFLHGAAFSAQTWIDNGLLAALSNSANTIAVDLPGFGGSEPLAAGIGREEFLTALLEAFGLEASATVIVSPSMSGGFSLPALRTDEFASLGGYVPVAPVGADEFVAAGQPLDVPALVVWGDRDGGDPAAAANRLAAGFTNAEVLILPDAGHAAYQDQPDLFADALRGFVAGISPTEP